MCLSILKIDLKKQILKLNHFDFDYQIFSFHLIGVLGFWGRIRDRSEAGAEGGAHGQD